MENGVLASALDKIRDGEGGAVALLSDEEAQALSAYLSAKTSETAMTEADRLLCRHVRIILQERASRPHPSDTDSHFQRTNLTLRAAIDLFLARDYPAVLEKDVALLRDTQARLEAMAVANGSSPNHARLSDLIRECLAAYGEWSSRQPAPPATADAITHHILPVVPMVPTVPAVLVPGGSPAAADAREFLSGAGLREVVPFLEGIPLAASVRIMVHEGDLTLRGELTDEFLLDVRGGSLEVHGGLFGYVVADGDITVHGSVQGGWLFSRSGSIRAARVLAGSVLIAPRGSIAADSAENPRLVYCGNDFSSEQGVRAGTFFARNFTAGEGVRKARIHLRGTLTARSIEVDSHDDAAGIQYRLAQTCHDFGRPIQEGVSTGLRSFGRVGYRRRAAAALLAYLESELLAMQRFRVFAMQAGGVDSSAVAPIRSAQGERAILAVLLELGEGLKELMVLGENIGHGMEVAFVNTGVDESTACLATVAKEIKMLCRSFVRDKEVIEAPCRHIASFAKKLKDTVRLGQVADKLLFDFDFRMDEWRAQIAQATADLETHEAAMAKLLGPTVWQVTDSDRLAALLTRMIQVAEVGGKLPRLMQTREMAALREHADQHAANRAPWRASLENLRGEYDQVIEALEESISLAVAEGGEQEIRTQNFGPGVRIQTIASIRKASGSSGAMVLVTGGQADTQGLVRMRNLRLYPEAGGT